MKLLLSIFLIFAVNSQVNSQIEDMNSFFSKSNSFFGKYVSNGQVDYASIQNDTVYLDVLVDFIGAANYENSAINEKKAFLINAYNLLVVNQIKANYPVSSPMDVSGFFKENKFKLAGSLMTLNHLENEVMRKKYSDPRYHFVLVCGAVDCPPLISKSYMPSTLEAQLEERTAAALNNDNFVYEEDGKVKLSEIFQWYNADFGVKSSKVLEYINGYRTTPFASKSIQYYSYDWALNSTQQSVETSPEMELVDRIEPISTNLQQFTAGSLLRKGQMDISMFNSVYTQTESNWLGVDYSGFRETFMTSLLQFSIGVDKKNRFNLGLDFNLRASAYSVDDSFSSITRPLALKNNDTSRVGLTSIGLRAKVAPFKSVKDLSFQSTFYVPTITDPEGVDNLFWADWDRLTLWNQLFYSKTWNKFQLFTELDALFRFKYHKGQITQVDVPVTVIGSYFPTPKITVYGIVQQNTRVTYDIKPQESTDWVLPINSTSVGGGLKIQPTSNFTIELLYTNFIRGTNSGLGEAFNIGFKFLTK